MTSNLRARATTISNEVLGPNNFSSELISSENLSSFLFQLRNSDEPLKRGRFFKIQKEFKDITGREFDVIFRPKKTTEPHSELSFISHSINMSTD